MDETCRIAFCMPFAQQKQQQQKLSRVEKKIW